MNLKVKRQKVQVFYHAEKLPAETRGFSLKPLCSKRHSQHCVTSSFLFKGTAEAKARGCSEALGVCLLGTKFGRGHSWSPLRRAWWTGPRSHGVSHGGGHSEGAGLDPENMRGRRWSGPEPPMFFINSFISDFK